MNKVALVTGGARGIGRAIAADLGRDHRLAITCHVTMPTDLPEGCFVIPADLANADSGHAVVEAVIAHYGQLDVIVNNAGVIAPSPRNSFDPQAMRGMMDVNLLAPYAILTAALPHLKPGATVTDVGSVKQAVIDAVGPHIPEGVDFVPGHPLAGTEHSGPLSGFASLFQNRWCLLVPTENSSADAAARLRALWEGMGANVDEMDAEHHDLVLAVTSHTPHLIAYTMVGVADDLRRVTDSEVIKYSAAGFRDFTRIAASDPTMWRDVFLTNKEATLEILGRFTEELFALQRAIRTGDGEHLFDYFTRTRAIRRGIIEAGQDTEAPDFGRSGTKE